MADKTWEMPDGIYTALVTPFAGSSVDKKAWEILIQRQIDAKVSGIVPVGCELSNEPFHQKQNPMASSQTVGILCRLAPLLRPERC